MLRKSEKKRFLWMTEATEGFLDSGLLYSSSFFFSLPSLHLFYQALRHVTS